MDKRKDFLGVNPDIRLDQILIDSNEHRPALFAMLNSFAVGTNPNFVVDGCAISWSGVEGNESWDVTAGYIFLNGELIKVDAQSGTGYDLNDDYLVFDKVVTYDPKGDVTYNNGAPRQTWEVNRGVITSQLTPPSNTQIGIPGEDRLDDKIKEYLGDASTNNKGIVEKATSTEAKNGSVDKFIDAELFQATTPTTTTSGTVEKATGTEALNGESDRYIDAELFQDDLYASSAEAIAGTNNTKWVSPAGLSARDGGLVTKVIEIDDWDMNADETTAVIHGLANIQKIRSISIMIRPDSDITGTVTPLDYTNSSGIANGTVSTINDSAVILRRITGGVFDSVNYNETTYNRGWITIKYIN